MPNAEFQADDAARAVSIMTEAATADLPFVSRAQSDADFTRIGSECHAAVAAVMQMHGLAKIGEAKNGSDEGAQAIIEEVNRYKSDPDAYVDALALTSMCEPANDSQPEEHQAAPDQTPVPLAAPTQSPPPQNIASETASIRIIPRPAKALFPDIGANYRHELVPTVHWQSPKPPIKTPDPDFVFNGHAISIMSLAVEERKNVIATGDPGCGKTEFFKQFGARVGLPVHKIPFDGSLTRAEMIGSFRQVATENGSATPFVYGLIPKLIQQPCIIILDEIDQCDPDIMYMLHSVLEGEGLVIQEEGGVEVPRHPHCYIVATANTKGRGSDNGLTHTRFEMSEATRDRFPYWLNFSFMKPDQEAATVAAKTSLKADLCQKMVTVANQIRTSYSNGELSQTCSIRQMLDVAPLATRFSGRGEDIGLAMGMDCVMAGRANHEDAMTIREFIKTATAVDLNIIEL